MSSCTVSLLLCMVYGLPCSECHPIPGHNRCCAAAAASLQLRFALWSSNHASVITPLPEQGSRQVKGCERRGRARLVPSAYARCVLQSGPSLSLSKILSNNRSTQPNTLPSSLLRPAPTCFMHAHNSLSPLELTLVALVALPSQLCVLRLSLLDIHDAAGQLLGGCVTFADTFLTQVCWVDAWL